MSNTRYARPLNRTSGIRQRPKGSWGKRRQAFAGSGLTQREQHGFLARMRASHVRGRSASVQVAGTFRVSGDR